MDPTQAPGAPAEGASNPTATIESLGALQGDYDDLADAIRKGDKQRAHSLLKKLSAAVDKPQVPVEPAEATKEEQNFHTQQQAAETSRSYRARASTRPLPTAPTIPEPVSYDQYFSRG
jgi:hypothetical protein